CCTLSRLSITAILLSYLVLVVSGYGDHRCLHSFPTRRSSDLMCWYMACSCGGGTGGRLPAGSRVVPPVRPQLDPRQPAPRRSTPDRKSTRLNSSHVKISYAVFCLKKKNHLKTAQRTKFPAYPP